MRKRPNTVNSQSLTGKQIQTISVMQMKHRVNAIKFRNSTKINNSREQSQTSFFRQPTNKIAEEETDQLGTNFWPTKPLLPRFSSISVAKKSQDALMKNDFARSRLRTNSMSTQNKNFRIFKSQHTTGVIEKKSTVDAKTFHRQLMYFKELYNHLGAVLSAIHTGFDDLESAVSDYGKYIQHKHMSFIDDFAENKQNKIKKTIRISRIHEYLSISYLFLEIAQDRINNNESYLVNFIGFCLSNLLYLTRMYIILEGRPQFESNQFQKQVQQFQITSYGNVLKKIDDVVLRIQHNNQIITMIHKKLGRYNEKFENCIKMFLKNAQRKKHSTCLCAHYIFQYLAMHIHESELVGISEFLQVAPAPFLAPSQHQYTLVFQPLGVFKEGDHLRPYLIQFLKWAHKHFDIVMWTWQMPSQVEDFVNLIDQYLFSKLYRYHCIIKNQIFTKDMTKLGRNLDKTFIIDYDQRIFAQTPKNGIVCRWKNKNKDNSLLVLSQVLEQMISTSSSIEDMLTFYAEQLESIKGF